MKSVPTLISESDGALESENVYVKNVCSGQRQDIRKFVEKLYLAYFGVKLGDQDKPWALHKVCTCAEGLQPWKSELNEILKINTSLKPRAKLVQGFIGFLKDVFLPNGYPDSVSGDYAEYQFWDTVQACASTITGALTTKVILQSVGVGNSEASAVSAAVTWILKDGSGMVSRITFAWLVGSALDWNCKKWRLFADIINDIAMCIELIVLPMYSHKALQILCASTSLKSLVGVAGGATRAAITQHQAIRQNMADVSAKDGSQETCVNLIASFVGLGVLSLVTDNASLWVIFFVMTTIHIFANYKAVKCLNFTFFNETRLLLVIQDFIKKNRVPGPLTTNKKEAVVLLCGPNAKGICDYNISLGRSLEKAFSKNAISPFELQYLIHHYKNRRYVIIVNERQKTIYVGLTKDASAIDVIEAYFHAVLIGIGLASTEDISTKRRKSLGFDGKNETSSILGKLLEVVKARPSETGQATRLERQSHVDELAAKYFKTFLSETQRIGWDVNRTLLPIHKWRVSFNAENKFESESSHKKLK